MSRISIPVGAGYRRLLDDVQATAAHRRMNLALDRLHRLVDRAQLDATLDRFPELLSPNARRQLGRDAAELAREEERRFVEAQLDLLEAWAGGDREAAWAATSWRFRQRWRSRSSASCAGWWRSSTR